MNEKSACILKPEARDHLSEIIKMITDAGLSIIHIHIDLVITVRQVQEEMMPEIIGEILRETEKRMVSGHCVLIVVEGEDAVKKLLAVSGLKTNPNECGENTIRGRFGVKVPVEILQNGVPYLFWENAVHRAKSKEEAEKILKLFSP